MKSTGPFARPLARSLASLTHCLAPYYSLRSHAPLRSFARIYSLAPELMGKMFLFMTSTHYGTKPGHFETSISHEQESE